MVHFFLHFSKLNFFPILVEYLNNSEKRGSAILVLDEIYKYDPFLLIDNSFENIIFDNEIFAKWLIDIAGSNQKNTEKIWNISVKLMIDFIEKSATKNEKIRSVQSLTEKLLKITNLIAIIRKFTTCRPNRHLPFVPKLPRGLSQMKICLPKSVK